MWLTIANWSIEAIDNCVFPWSFRCAIDNFSFSCFISQLLEFSFITEWDCVLHIVALYRDCLKLWRIISLSLFSNTLGTLSTDVHKDTGRIYIDESIEVLLIVLKHIGNRLWSFPNCLKNSSSEWGYWWKIFFLVYILLADVTTRPTNYVKS